ncbi:filamentous hemagglutinin N-terminal domain-containing protein, partial [Helicobacter sp. MIT 01-3238]|uniref:filamentous hemagglutinin N-terminal domain-containing protein n=1 Tax=Helicobacter sp. MIT 01-3238 TaxID=398627 RepID=UPI000E1E8593
ITTPNAKGISNNHYIDFNIKPKGAILNNSLQSITSTHLAGFISSNPHLKDFSASLILNQVTSANPSYLLGMLEVAGDKASVLIANPNGIVCKSCGFSNVANLALSTALIEDKLALNEKWLNNNTINTNATNSINNINTTNNNTASALSNANSTQSQQSHQSLQEQLKHNLSLRVQKGHINIDSLNASNTTTLTLLSKSL